LANPAKAPRQEASQSIELSTGCKAIDVPHPKQQVADSARPGQLATSTRQRTSVNSHEIALANGLQNQTQDAYICNYNDIRQVFTLFNLWINPKARPARANPLNSAFSLSMNPNCADPRLS